MVLSSYSLLEFNMFRNLEDCLPSDSFIHYYGESGFLSMLFERGSLLLIQETDHGPRRSLIFVTTF